MADPLLDTIHHPTITNLKELRPGTILFAFDPWRSSVRGKVSGQDILARFATALGGRLHQAIYSDDGTNAAIA